MTKYLDIHVLQSVPASCINRDDIGSPKTLIYGGTQRARVSSQAWKKAVRDLFKELFDANQLGVRTRKVDQLMQNNLKKLNADLSEEQVKALAETILDMSGVKSKDAKEVLFFISNQQIENLAKLANDKKDVLFAKKIDAKEEKEIKKQALDILTECPGVDMILFGRMAASNPSLNYDATCQVAHSFSTHTVKTEYDYFTAVDDFKEAEDSGAGHIGTVEYNSSTLYRYATINVSELTHQLGREDGIDATGKFIDAFVRSMPTGKQNTFANRTLPDFVYVTVREDQPINMAGAFEKPVKTKENGYFEPSLEALRNYITNIYEKYEANPIEAWNIGGDDTFGKKVGFKQLIAEVTEYLNR